MKKAKVAQWGGKHIVYMPMYVALHRGYFREYKLEIEVYPAGNDDEIYAEVASGKAHFGVGDPTFVAHGAARGDDTRVIAALVNNGSTWGYTHHPEIHDFKKPEDFAGLRFGTYPAPSTSYALIANIKRTHAKKLRSMEIIEAQIGELAPLLASGKVDVILEIEPMISIAEQQGLRTVLSVGDFYPAFLYTGVSTRQETIEQEPEMVEAFVKGIQAGLTTCHREPETLIEVAREMFPAVSDECMSLAIHRMLNNRAWPEQALIQASSWQSALKLRQDLGELEPIAEPTALLEQSFAYSAITSV